MGEGGAVSGAGVRAQLENGHIYRRICYFEDLYVRSEGKFSRQ